MAVCITNTFKYVYIHFIISISIYVYTCFSCFFLHHWLTKFPQLLQVRRWIPGCKSAETWRFFRRRKKSLKLTYMGRWQQQIRRSPPGMVQNPINTGSIIIFGGAEFCLNTVWWTESGVNNWFWYGKYPHFSQGFKDNKWCRISSINSSTKNKPSPPKQTSCPTIHFQICFR